LTHDFCVRIDLGAMHDETSSVTGSGLNLFSAPILSDSAATRSKTNHRLRVTLPGSEGGYRVDSSIRRLLPVQSLATSVLGICPYAQKGPKARTTTPS
jgi:hypothetical protein